MNYTPQQIQQAVDAAYEEARRWVGTGTMPDFIPALEHEDPSRLSVCLMDMQGKLYTAGNYSGTFSVQSISKIILLELALREAGEEAVLARIGVEPSGSGFNSFYAYEGMRKIPYNPFINAGAITSASLIRGGSLEEKYEKFRALAAQLLGAPDLTYDAVVCDCEMKTGHRNRALASILLHNGVLEGDPEEHLELYYRGCAFRVTAAQVCRFGAILAGDGLCPETGERLLEVSHCRLFRGLMATCGMYDSTGQYAVDVGIPAKSGSGGGIVAVARGKAGLAVYGPELDGRGNSVCGMKALASLAESLDLRVY